MAIWLPNLAGRNGPKYLQIVEAMADDIANGRLAVGAMLPPHRELAYQLGLSPNTTSRAYAEGVKRALLRGEVGRGTFVRATTLDLDQGTVGDLRRPSRSGPIDLSRNLPFPGIAEPYIRAVLNTIGDNKGLASLLDYQVDADLSRHVTAAIRWLELCGLTADPDDVVMTSGVQHGLFCTLMALFQPGDLLLVEALSYPPVLAMAQRLGLETRAVAIDDDGLCPDDFARQCATAAPKALYLVPTLHVPTTRTLCTDRRSAILNVAERHNVLVIEDDVFGLLKPDRPDPIATQASDRVIYATSVSKSLAPGLRIGFLRAPPKFVPALRQAVNLTLWMPPPMTAEVASRLILERTAETLIDAQRANAASRQRLAQSILKSHSIESDPHGLHLWLILPNGWKADSFRLAAEKQGVLVTEAQSFAANQGRPHDEAIRICLSHEPDLERVRVGFSTLSHLLDTPPLTRSLAV